jgi:predicted transposase/invertase (TIGR01784 family)
MGYSRTERVLVKKEFLRMLVKMEINPAKMELINGFFETYLTLNESEEKVLMEEIKQLNPDESEQILKLPNSWVEKGIKEGIKKGESEGKRKIALNMLKEGLSIELIVRVTNLDYTEIEKIIKHNL